jgi:AcrR family transcriptional regulator
VNVRSHSHFVKLLRYTCPVREDALAPKQRRSRETLSRLLQATIEVLDEEGLVGATVPRIARVAGVAPASIYRRFQDRDALLRAAFVHVLEQSERSTRSVLRIETFRDKTLGGVIRALVGATIQQYVRYPRLMRAFVQFTENDSDRTFRKRALELVSSNLTAGVDLLLKHFRSEIKQSNPKRALTFALLSVAAVIEERAMAEVSLWRTLLPVSNTQLQHDLTRMVLGYLR